MLFKELLSVCDDLSIIRVSFGNTFIISRVKDFQTNDIFISLKDKEISSLGTCQFEDNIYKTIINTVYLKI